MSTDERTKGPQPGYRICCYLDAEGWHRCTECGITLDLCNCADVVGHAMRRIQTPTFKEFSAVNHSRALEWHTTEDGVEEWSPAEWGNALAGEVGELCNYLKKILRHDKGIQQMAVGTVPNSTLFLEDPEYRARAAEIRQGLVDAAAKEIADSFTYLDLVATRIGVDLLAATIDKFNEISEREGLPQRLPVPGGES